MKYYIIAGEASGDLHASNLMEKLKKKDSEAKFRFWGGDLMASKGGEQVKHYKETAFMGFFDVFKNLNKIFAFLKLCKKDILQYKPDAVILVDYPGFNLRIAEFASQNGFKVYYYISPKIWAWKQSRAHKIKKYVHKMFVIFPFEIDFYKKFNYNAYYVGNPLLDSIENYKNLKVNPEDFKKKYQISDKPVVALLPGSRKQEIANMLPLMSKIAEKFPDYQFIIAGAPSLEKSIYEKYFIETESEIKIIYNETYNILSISKAAIITSGTATLEAALFNVPQLVCYKGDNLSYQIAKRLVKVDFISPVNLILGKEAVKEYIQSQFSSQNITKELNLLLSDEDYRKKIFNNYSKMNDLIGSSGASEKTAEIIYKDLIIDNLQTI